MKNEKTTENQNKAKIPRKAIMWGKGEDGYNAVLKAKKLGINIRASALNGILAAIEAKKSGSG